MDDYRHLVGKTGPIPDQICLRVNDESEVWALYNCKCSRHDGDGKGDSHVVVAQSIDEMLATAGSGDYAKYNRYQAFVLG